jgi:hypothetical protein
MSEGLHLLTVGGSAMVGIAGATVVSSDPWLGGAVLMPLGAAGLVYGVRCVIADVRREAADRRALGAPRFGGDYPGGWGQVEHPVFLDQLREGFWPGSGSPEPASSAVRDHVDDRGAGPSQQ